MGYSKKLDRYPSHFMALAQKTSGSSSAIVIPCPDEKTAHALRFQLNAFRKALDTYPELAQSVSGFMGASFKLVRNPSIAIRIEPPDHSAIAQLLVGIIDEAAVASPQSPVETPVVESQSESSLSTESLVNSFLNSGGPR